MKIVVHAPYGMFNQETGILFLLAKYVRTVHEQIVQFRCNGAFSVCDRDSEVHWKRPLSHCLHCEHEQKGLATWAGLSSIDIAGFLAPDEVNETRKWVTFLKKDALLEAEHQGVRLFDLVRHSFRLRFSTDQPDLENKLHEDVLRRLLLAALRMTIASRKFITQELPDLILVAGGKDLLTASLLTQGRAQGRQVSQFQWDIANRAIKISHPERQTALACGLLLEDVSSMRNDTRTWPSEIVSILDEILEFLGVSMVRQDVMRPLQVGAGS